jgi:hypothetical protein
MDIEKGTTSGQHANLGMAGPAGYAERQPNGMGMKVSGLFMTILGLLVIAAALLFDVGVDAPAAEALQQFSGQARITNLSLVSMREMIMLTGGFVFVSGWILFAAGHISLVLSSTTHRF